MPYSGGHGRAGAIKFWADILRAQEIFSNPSPLPEERRFAELVAWLVKVNKLVESRTPSHPLERATVPVLKREHHPQLPTQEEIEFFERWSMANCRAILQQVLDELPDPDGVIQQSSSFYIVDSFDG